MPENQQLYAEFAAAYVRGEALAARENGGRIASPDADLHGKPLVLPSKLLQMSPDTWSEEETAQCLALGKAAGLKLYRFKNTHDVLPRVKKALGFLRGITFESLLDVGSGRGVFLWPFLDAFPWVKVESIDLLPLRVDFLQKTALGGVDRLHASQEDLCRLGLDDKSVDVVTMLEVLEHIPDTETALANAVRVARRCVVLSVPSKEDNNPEHIHLFTKASLTAYFERLGVKGLHFDGVNGHLLLYAMLEE